MLPGNFILFISLLQIGLINLSLNSTQNRTKGKCSINLFSMFSEFYDVTTLQVPEQFSFSFKKKLSLGLKIPLHFRPSHGCIDQSSRKHCCGNNPVSASLQAGGKAGDKSCHRESIFNLQLAYPSVLLLPEDPTTSTIVRKK